MHHCLHLDTIRADIEIHSLLSYLQLDLSFPQRCHTSEVESVL